MDDAQVIIDSFDFLSLVMRDSDLRRSGRYYTGPCPICTAGGGTDRFVLKEAEAGRFIWICRVCSPGKYHDAADYVMRRESLTFPQALEWMKASIGESPTPIARERVEKVDFARQAEIDARLSDMTTHEIWEALHRRLQSENREWWRAQGVPDEWQDYLSLGFMPDKGYYDKNGGLQNSPAYTIPYFHYDIACDLHRRFVTLQYRLVNPVDPCDRYRFEKGLGSSFYMATPTMPLQDQVLICEGAKKAIVARVWGGIKDKTVIGLPSKGDFAGIDEYVKECGRVWIMLDPDAQKSSHDLCRRIGKAARMIELPIKIDDALIQKYITKERLPGILRQGVKVC